LSPKRKRRMKKRKQKGRGEIKRIAEERPLFYAHALHVFDHANRMNAMDDIDGVADL